MNTIVLNTGLSLKAFSRYNRLGYKEQALFNQIIKEGVIPKELLFRLLEECWTLENFGRNLRAVVRLMNNPRVVNYTQNEEKRVHIVNSKEKKCQILAVLFSKIKETTDETVAYFDTNILDQDLHMLECVNDFGINNAEMTRVTIHEIIRGLNPEMFGKLENPLVCIAQQAYQI